MTSAPGTAMVTHGDDAVEVVDVGTVEALTRAEIDRQIATAKAYPRNVVAVKKSLAELVTSDPETAASCMYKLPRGGKSIEGGSVRFAEMLAYSWGNCRVGARVVAVEAEYVIAQGFFFDLERNSALSFEVKRRITDRNGKRYDADMIGVTGNAACGVAYRNAVLKCVPKPFWQGAYDAAVKVVRGTGTTLKANVETAMAYAGKFGVSEVQILAALGVTSVAEITQDHLVDLRGMLQSIKDGETTIDAVFPAEHKAVRDTAATAFARAVESGGEAPGTWLAKVREAVEERWNGGERMGDDDYYRALTEVARAVDPKLPFDLHPGAMPEYRSSDHRKWYEHVMAMPPLSKVEPVKAAAPPVAEDPRKALGEEIKRVYGMTKPAQRLKKAGEVMSMVRGSRIEYERADSIAPSEALEMVNWLREKFPPGTVAPADGGGGATAGAEGKDAPAVMEAEPEPVAPHQAPLCRFPGCGGEAVVIGPQGAFCDDHAPAEEAPEPEAPPAEEVVEAEPPADDLADAALRAIHERDGKVNTLFMMAANAAKSGRAYAKEAPKGSGSWWFVDGPILRAKGSLDDAGQPKSILLQRNKEQAVSPDDCRWLIRQMREAGVTLPGEGR